MVADAAHVVDPVEPTTKLDGMMWTNPEELEDGMAVTRVWDADNSEWLQIGGPGLTGPQGPQGPPGAPGDEGGELVAAHAGDWDAHWAPMFMTNDDDNPASPGVSPDWSEVTGVRLVYTRPAGWGTALFAVHGVYETEFSGRTLEMSITEPGGVRSEIVKVLNATVAFGRVYLRWMAITPAPSGNFSLWVRSSDGAGAGNWASLECSLFRMS